MSEPKNDRRPRRWRLQFSLRLLLLALTAFAIGFPIWYRWPYSETVEQRDPATGKLWATRTITWQRQWGGGRLQHGPEQTIFDAQRTTTTNYVYGKRHGAYTVRDVKDRVRVTGEYVDNLKEGRWVEETEWKLRTASGRRQTIISWHRGLLDGECEFPSGREWSQKNVATFVNGRLMRFNGRPVDDAAFDVLKLRDIDEYIRHELESETQVDFVEQPLKDIAMYMSELHKVPIAIDRRKGLQSDLPITCSCRGLDLRSALILLLAPHDLACDYRYGALWITRADDIRDWHDPTSVDRIKPPAGSALARAWNQETAIDFVQTPLADAMAFIDQLMALNIDAGRATNAADGSPVLVTTTVRGLPLRHAMGQLLYNSGCRCRLEGDTLVILPPEDKEK